jgi:hypothetical protein
VSGTNADEAFQWRDEDHAIAHLPSSSSAACTAPYFSGRMMATTRAVQMLACAPGTEATRRQVAAGPDPRTELGRTANRWVSKLNAAGKGQASGKAIASLPDV